MFIIIELQFQFIETFILIRKASAVYCPLCGGFGFVNFGFDIKYQSIWEVFLANRYAQAC